MDRIGDYVVKQSFECLNGCLTGYLNLAGYDLEACDIFFGGGGYHLCLIKGEGQFRSNLASANYRFMKKHDIFYKKGNVSFFKNRKKYICDSIENDRYLSIRVEAECLDYCKALQHTEGASHYINLLAFDEKRNNVYIADGDIPTLKPSVFQGWVDMEMILCAWKKQNCEYHIWELEQLFLQEDEVKRDTIIGAVEALGEYTEGGVDLYGMPFGQTAVRELFMFLKEIFENGFKDFNIVSRNLNYQMKTGGFIGEKYFLLQLIERELKGDEIVKEYETMIHEWNTCCLMLVKLGIYQEDDLMDRLYERASGVLERELLCMKKIKQKLETVWNKYNDNLEEKFL